MEINSDFKTRLATAMRMRGIRPYQLSEKSGISRRLISGYMNGKFKAKQEKITILAKALDVNEIWLMGFDCDPAPIGIKRNDDEKTEVYRLLEELSPEEIKKVKIFIEEILK